MNTAKETARIAGAIYLVIAITGGFGHFMLHNNLVVQGDAAATVKNLTESEGLFRLTFVSNLICQLCFVLLPLFLYRLLKPVNKNHAILMIVLVLVAVPIACLNLLSQLAALLVLGDAGYLKVFEPGQLNALAMLFLDIQGHGVLIAQVFWGLWLFPLGYLVFKSGFIPKILGILLMIACFVYVIGSFISFLAPDYSKAFEAFFIEPSIAEISFCLWLLIKGVGKDHAG